MVQAGLEFIIPSQPLKSSECHLDRNIPGAATSPKSLGLAVSDLLLISCRTTDLCHCCYAHSWLASPHKATRGTQTSAVDLLAYLEPKQDL